MTGENDDSQGFGVRPISFVLIFSFFEGQATEHLLGAEGLSEHPNDDCLGRDLDAFWQAGLSQVLVIIALQMYQIFCLTVFEAQPARNIICCAEYGAGFGV